MARPRNIDTKTGDLFAVSEVFPAVEKQALRTSLDFNFMVSRLIADALKQSPISRAEVAAQMSEMLNEDVSVNMLNAYASQGRLDHNISLVRFLALVRATQQPWMWQSVLQDEGITILVGEELRLAQIGMARKKIKDAQNKVKEMERHVKSLENLAPSALAHQEPASRERTTGWEGSE